MLLLARIVVFFNCVSASVELGQNYQNMHGIPVDSRRMIRHLSEPRKLVMARVPEMGAEQRGRGVQGPW